MNPDPPGRAIGVAFLVANSSSRVSQIFGLAATGISHQHGLVTLDGDIFVVLVGRLIHQFLVLSHQGFGDAAADGVNLGERPLPFTCTCTTTPPLSPSGLSGLLVAQKQIQVQHLRLQFVASCFTFVEVCSERFGSSSFTYSEDLHRLQRGPLGARLQL